MTKGDFPCVHFAAHVVEKIERRTFLGGAIAAAVVPGVYELTVEQFAALIEERVESWA